MNELGGGRVIMEEWMSWRWQGYREGVGELGDNWIIVSELGGGRFVREWVGQEVAGLS